MMEGVILCYYHIVLIITTLLLIRVRVGLNLLVILTVYFFYFCLFVCCISIPEALCWAPEPPVVILKVWLSGALAVVMMVLMVAVPVLSLLDTMRIDGVKHHRAAIPRLLNFQPQLIEEPAVLFLLRRHQQPGQWKLVHQTLPHIQ